MARQMDDAQASAVAAQAAQHGRRCQLPRLGPQLEAGGLPRVTTLTDELARATRGRDRFAAFPAVEFQEAATIIDRYRISPSRFRGKLRRTHAPCLRAIFGK